MTDWYDVSGAPGDHAEGASAAIRGEFTLIAAAFLKLPAITGQGDEIVKVNALGTGFETVASIGVPQGGSGAATFTDGGILLGSGASAFTATARPTLNQVLIGQTSGDPILVSGTTLRTALGLGTGDSPTFAGLTLSAALTVANGGTGAGSFTAHGILLGAGTSQFVVTAAPTNGEVLVGVTGSDPALQSGATLRTSLGLGTASSVTFASLTLGVTPLAVASGGTGAASHTAGSFLIGNGGSALSLLALTTKGSIFVGDGSGAPTALGVGTNGQVLSADSGEATGTKWITLGGAGLGTMSTVQSDDSPVGDADITTLNFGLEFDVEELVDTIMSISIVSANEGVFGIIAVATQGQVNAGTAGSRAVTPAKLAAFPGHTNTITVGTLTSGTWNATTIDVAHGGTGLTTLTDGGHLLGNATTAIEVTARPTLGEVLVGQTSGSPVLQSGATLRTTLGIVNNVNHSGDATGDTVLTIAANAVTNTKAADMAVNTIKGRITSGTGDPEDLTMIQTRSMLNVEDGSTADMTASEIRAALLTVDGPGSGLDADLLDGVQGASYLRSDTNATFTGIMTVIGSGAVTGTWQTGVSDGRLKEDWKELRNTLNHMRQVRIGTFVYNSTARELNPEFRQDRRHLGMVAQDIEVFWPEAVAPAPFDTHWNGYSKSGENYLTLQYERLVPVLWQAVIDLEDEIRNLRAQLLP